MGLVDTVDEKDDALAATNRGSKRRKKLLALGQTVVPVRSGELRQQRVDDDADLGRE